MLHDNTPNMYEILEQARGAASLKVFKDILDAGCYIYFGAASVQVVRGSLRAQLFYDSRLIVSYSGQALSSSMFVCLQMEDVLPQ